MYYGILNGKVFDMCSDLRNTRTKDNGVPIDTHAVQYFELDLEDVWMGDSWDFENNVNIPDAPQRFIEPEPNEIEKLWKEIEKIWTEINNIKSILVSINDVLKSK